MKTLIIAALSSLFLAISLANAGEKLFPGGVGIEGHAISIPVGSVLLIQREDAKVAIKFLANEGKKEGILSKYEYYDLSSLKKSTGVIWMKEPSTGFWANLKGMFVHDPFSYADEIRFSKFTLFAHPNGLNHSAIYFWSKPQQVDTEVIMAPTPWKEIGEVTLSDPRIRWLAYDEKREWKVIPIEKIWD